MKLCQDGQKDLLIADHSNHISVVVHRDDCFYDFAEDPEGLFFGKLHGEEKIRDKVEPLAVANKRVPPGEGNEDVAEGLKFLLRRLAASDSSIDVLLDAPDEVVGIGLVGEELLIQSLVMEHVESCSRCKEPDRLASLMTTDCLFGQFVLEDADQHPVGLSLWLRELFSQFLIGILLRKQLGVLEVDFGGVPLFTENRCHGDVPLTKEHL